MTVQDFPAVNASLNAASGVLLLIGYVMIKAKRYRAHAYFVIAALVMSAAFLACYLTYHALKGGVVTRFPESPWRTPYLAVLISHTILAVVILPMVAMSVWRAYRRRWDKHRRIAAPTFWLWLYVSVTGVVVYWMLYHLAPRLAPPAVAGTVAGQVISAGSL